MRQDIICAGTLTEETLTRSIDEFFRRLRPQRERMYDYYRGEQPVPKGEAVRGRPNNLLRVPFPRYITEVHTGYFLGLPPTLALDRPEDGNIFRALAERIGLNHLLFDIGRDMSICGTGFALVFFHQRRSILQMSMTPDLSDDSFAGQASGVALQYKLWGVEQERSAKERSFLEGFRSLLAALSGGLSILGTAIDLTAGKAAFYKNLPQNNTELAETLLSLSPCSVQPDHSGTLALGGGCGGGAAAKGGRGRRTQNLICKRKNSRLLKEEV